MAHSTATSGGGGGGVTTGEINYFYKDENGAIVKYLKPADIKTESSCIVGSGARMGAFSQMNQAQYMRATTNNVYNNPMKTDNTSYALAATAQNNSSIGSGHLNDTITTTAIVTKSERFGKYNTQNNNNINNMKMKSKLHSIQGGNSNGSSSSNNTTHNTSSSSVQRKRKPDKAGKGLRHFSMKVCEKVKEKGKTTYNEVADELVNEELKNTFDTNCDQKNIRRRVYDALNVLMAINIISKDKKEIGWIGFPTNSVECSALEKENEERRERIKQKHQQLRELIMHQVAFKSLIERNKQSERQGIVPTPNSSLQLPFITVNTYKSTKINCSVTNDKSEYIFKFDDKFEMHDDIEVLKRMGLLFGLDKGQCSPEAIERAKSLVPPNFAKYIEAYGRGEIMCESDDEDLNKSYMQLTTNESQHHGYAATTQNTTDEANTNDLDDEDDYSDIE